MGNKMEIYLRNLTAEDSNYMLEWMHDPDVVAFLTTDFMHRSKEDCLRFIEDSNRETCHLHMAVSDENNRYLGTVSLKNISVKHKNAEYAIALRRMALGRGIARIATGKILKKAFEELELRKVYLCVLKENQRAIKFYSKCKFTCEGNFRNHIQGTDKDFHDLYWFSILKEEYDMHWRERK